jgi:hypothetical protein
MSDLFIVALIIVCIYMFYNFSSKPASKVITKSSASSQIPTVLITQPIIDTLATQKKDAPVVPITQQKASTITQSTPQIVEIPLPFVPPSKSMWPKLYETKPIYYSENIKNNFGGWQGEYFNEINPKCPAGTSIIQSTTGPNGPQASYYVSPLNNYSQKDTNFPASCPTKRIAGNKQMIGNKNVNYKDIESSILINPSDTVLFNNSNLSGIWGDPCPNYNKSLELVFTCAPKGIDPGDQVNVIPYSEQVNNPPPTPPPPKQLPPPTKNTVYRASPIYYSEKATTGGVQGRLYTTKVSCPAGTKVITDDSGPNGPKLGYYVNPINLGLQPSINIPASCPTTMDKALKPNLRSFGTLSPEGDVAMFSMNMSANIGDPCPSFIKSLELDLSCSIDGVDPGINADIIPYN